MSGSITIRDIPEGTRAELRARAARDGQSLQEYLRAHLIALADKPDMKTLMAQIEDRLKRTGTHVPTERMLEHLDASRT